MDEVDSSAEVRCRGGQLSIGSQIAVFVGFSRGRSVPKSDDLLGLKAVDD